jgi:hypothetical protein
MAKQIASSNSKPGAWIVSPQDKGRKLLDVPGLQNKTNQMSVKFKGLQVGLKLTKTFK